LFFFLVAKIMFCARFEENVVYIAKMTGEISNFVCFLYFHGHAPQPRDEISDFPSSGFRLSVVSQHKRCDPGHVGISAIAFLISSRTNLSFKST